MRVNYNGNIGIGTTSPEQRLHVASVSDQYIAKFSHSTATGYAPGSILLEAGQGDSRGQGIFHYNTVADDSWFTGVPYNVASTKWIVSHKPDTTFNPDVAQLSHAILTIDSSNNNVGIGTSSPGVPLDVFGSDGIRATTNSGALTDGYFAQMKSDFGANALRLISRKGDVFRASNYGQDVSILTGNPTSERIRVTSAGNVGIGTTSPAYKLDVAGVIQGTGSIRVDAGSPYFGLYNSGTEKAYLQWSQANSLLTLQSDGDIEIKPGANNVGIGTDSPASKLEVDGGDIEVDDSASGLILRSPDGTRYRVTVANGGTLSVSAV